RYGLADQGVAYAMDDFNKNLLSADVLKKTEDLKSKIIQGKIKVTDFYKVKR
ncbi:MAG: hypothetical protein HYX41_00330, partial [Bdellovibrio sp.]|nr:hypothetical protein [Bdellovibrio sp.]